MIAATNLAEGSVLIRSRRVRMVAAREGGDMALVANPSTGTGRSTATPQGIHQDLFVNLGRQATRGQLAPAQGKGQEGGISPEWMILEGRPDGSRGILKLQGNPAVLDLCFEKLHPALLAASAKGPSKGLGVGIVVVRDPQTLVGRAGGNDGIERSIGLR